MSNYVFSGHQPNFLPYMGYFYKMFQSDVFVLDDDVQYSQGAYHNTNFIKVNGRRFKITVPVSYDYRDPINAVRICYERNWQRKLLRTISINYGKAPHFEEGYSLLEEHISRNYEYLADLNIVLIKDIVERLHIGCKILVASQDIPTELTSNARNIYQCLALGGNVYYSGIGGKDYNDEAAYRENGIDLVYSDYEPVKYRQVGGGEFIENLSVIDYIFNQGFHLPDSWRRHYEE